MIYLNNVLILEQTGWYQSSALNKDFISRWFLGLWNSEHWTLPYLSILIKFVCIFIAEPLILRSFSSFQPENSFPWSAIFWCLSDKAIQLHEHIVQSWRKVFRHRESFLSARVMSELRNCFETRGVFNALVSDLVFPRLSMCCAFLLFGHPRKAEWFLIHWQRY